MLDLLIGFIQEFGYSVVLLALVLCGLGLPVPEDIILVAGGIIAGMGYADPNIMFIISMIGVLVGDSTIFLIGKKFSDDLTDNRFFKRFLKRASYNSVQEKILKNVNWVLFTARFTPGLRMPTYLISGMNKNISFLRFLTIDFTAAIISVPIWVYLGYYGAEQREWLEKWMKVGQNSIYVVLIIVIITLFFIWRYRSKKKREKI